MALTKAHNRMLSFAPSSADGIVNFEELESEVLVSDAISVNANLSYFNVPHTVFKQSDGANISNLITINLSNSLYTRIGNLNLYVDGNKDNNTAVTGIKVTELKRNSNYASLSASDCDVGVHITDQVETAKLDIYADNCGTGLLIDTDDTVTPDELNINLLAHSCDTFFETSGNNKTSGTITFGCEQSNGTAVKINQGYWGIYGVIRGCCTNTLGTALKIEQDATSVPANVPYVSGNITVFGGDDVNCEWAADISDATIDGLQVNINGSFASGCKIHNITAGSARVKVNAVAASGNDLEIGSTSAPASAFNLLAGSRANTVNMIDARRCVLDFEFLSSLTISSSSFDNTVYIPRQYAETVSFTNNRSAGDNKIILRGNYTLAELNSLNGGTDGSGCFKGMEAEGCATFDQTRAYFDGIQWVPSHGALASGQLTISSGTKSGSTAHGLSYDPGNLTLSFYSNSNPSGSGQFQGNVTTTNVVVIAENNVTSDVVINWVLRKED